MQAFVWNGEAMIPAKPKLADKAFVIGQRYWLEEVSERSWVSHRHEFAFVHKAWENLNEEDTERFPSPEHLRKAALIATGWFRETIIEAGSKTAALRVMAYVKNEDEFAHVVVRGPTVFVRKARSQRMHGRDRMDKQQFRDSKDAILGWISQRIGVDPDQLLRAA
jgi:hypothetical protein